MQRELDPLYIAAAICRDTYHGELIIYATMPEPIDAEGAKDRLHDDALVDDLEIMKEPVVIRIEWIDGQIVATVED